MLLVDIHDTVHSTLTLHRQALYVETRFRRFVHEACLNAWKGYYELPLWPNTSQLCGPLHHWAYFKSHYHVVSVQAPFRHTMRHTVQTHYETHCSDTLWAACGQLGRWANVSWLLSLVWDFCDPLWDPCELLVKPTVRCLWDHCEVPVWPLWGACVTTVRCLCDHYWRWAAWTAQVIKITMLKPDE